MRRYHWWRNHSARRGLAVLRGGLVFVPSFGWLSNCSVVVPAQAWFTLALSAGESGLRGVRIEQDCHCVEGVVR